MRVKCFGAAEATEAAQRTPEATLDEAGLEGAEDGCDDQARTMMHIMILAVNTGC